ncbi:hypothetical protein [Parasphingorhabdus sp.]|uniref:hypothetical protein n=1 Tax=Parasphingorhabdus sp. TaxID=2709688 RepID=UPI00359483E3
MTVARDRLVYNFGLEGDFVEKHSSRGHVASCDEYVLKARVRTPDFFDHRAEEGHQRFAAEGWADIAKRYLAGRLYFRIGAIWRDGSALTKVRKHYAIIKVTRPGNNEAGMGIFNSEVVEERNAAGSSDGDQFHMFVDVRHEKDGPESLVPSTVRLCSKDGFSQIAIEVAEKTNSVSMFVESSAFASEIFPTISGREVNLFGVNLSGAQSREGDGSLIEGGSKLVDKFSGENVHDFWRTRIENDFREFVSGLRIRIDNDPAQVRIEKLPLGAFKFDEMVICSV